MSTMTLLVLLAGILLAAILLRAGIRWSIDGRNAEDNFEPAPERLRKSKRMIIDNSPLLDEVSSAAEIKSSQNNLSRIPVQELSELTDLASKAKHSQPAEEIAESEEEYTAAFGNANNDPPETDRNNALPPLSLNSMRSGPEAWGESVNNSRVQLSRVAGRTIINVDGMEYSLVMDIPDPEMRELARKMILGFPYRFSDLPSEADHPEL